MSRTEDVVDNMAEIDALRARQPEAVPDAAAVVAEAARLLQAWLDEGGCECEGASHHCGIQDVRNSIEDLRALAAALTNLAPAAVDESWREGWALAYSGPALYRDDGELQDNQMQPFIDWRRDSAATIRTKITERGNRIVAAQQEVRNG